MRRGRSTIGLAVGAWCALAAAAAAQDLGSFRDWWAACGETRACQAFGFAPLGESGFVRVERGAAAEAPVRLLLAAPAEGDGAPPTVTLRVSVEGAALEPMSVRAEASPYAGLYLARVEDAAAVRRLVQAMRQGRALVLQPQGFPAARVSLDGASAALRWLDDRQRRAGTVTALVATGPTPAAGVPPPPPKRVVRQAPPVAQTGLPTAFPQAMRSHPAVRACREIDPSAAPDVFNVRLGAGRMLWGVGCGHGAYNRVFQMFLGDEGGRNLRPLRLNTDGGPGATVLNPGFDGRTMRLSAFAKARGLGDCGGLETWTWTGLAFEPVSERVMGECRGVPPELWPEVLDVDLR